jgi:hypothetical protein
LYRISPETIRAFPRTNGTAASPERPSNPITGSINAIIHGNTGVNYKMVTSNVIGKITFPNVHMVANPCFRPWYNITDIKDNPSLLNLSSKKIFYFFFFFEFLFFDFDLFVLEDFLFFSLET